MPDPKKDLDFTFNPKPIVDGFKKIADTSMRTFKGIIAKVGLLVAAFRGLKGVMNSIPEIGKALGIAKDVFLKNLLWPLRQAVMPLLQKLLNWVRDNRGMFVKWGFILKNIFNVVAKAVKFFWDILKGVGTYLFGILNRILGINTKTMEEFINLMTFKLAVGFELLKKIMGPIGEALKPLVNFVAQIAGAAFQGVINFFSDLFTKGTVINSMFSSIYETVKMVVEFIAKTGMAFFKGFLSNIQAIGEPLARIFETVKNIVAKFIGGKETLQGWEKIFKFIGEVLSGTIAIALDLVATTLEAIQKIIEFFQAPDLGERIMKRLEKFPEFIMTGKMPAEKKPVSKSHDAFISKDGKLFPIDSDDNVIATKGGGVGGRSVIFDFSHMTVNLASGSQDEAKRAADDIVGRIRTQLNLELSRTGGL